MYCWHHYSQGYTDWPTDCKEAVAVMHFESTLPKWPLYMSDVEQGIQLINGKKICVCWNSLFNISVKSRTVPRVCLRVSKAHLLWLSTSASLHGPKVVEAVVFANRPLNNLSCHWLVDLWCNNSISSCHEAVNPKVEWERARAFVDDLYEYKPLQHAQALGKGGGGVAALLTQ